MLAVTTRASRPMVSPARRSCPRSTYMNPTNSTMNEAPSREPTIMA